MLNRLAVLDGGFASELNASGLKVDGDVLWSARALIIAPDLVVQIHRRYQANIERMITNEGMSSHEAIDILRSSVRLARKAVETAVTDQHIYIVASIGPYATTFADASEYNGHYVDTTAESVMTEYFYRQAIELIDEGVDAIAFETIPARLEARCVLRALDRLPSSCTAWISFSCKDGTSTNYGDSFCDTVREIAAHNRIIGIGINCTSPIYVTDLLKSAINSTDKPFIVYPNSGEIYSINDKQWHNTNDHDKCSINKIDQYIDEWIKLGARAIGGCCRVMANDIAHIAKVIQNKYI